MDKLLYGESRAVVSNPETLQVIQGISRGIVFCYNIMLYEEKLKYTFWRQLGSIKVLCVILQNHLLFKLMFFEFSLQQKDKLDKENRKIYEAYKKQFYYSSEFDFNNKLTALKKENPWLKNIISAYLQGVSIDLHKALTNYKKTGFGFPRYKKIDPKKNIVPNVGILLKKSVSQIKSIENYNSTNNIKRIKFRYYPSLIDETLEKKIKFIWIYFIDHRDITELKRTYKESYRINLIKGKDLRISLTSEKLKEIKEKRTKTVVAIDRNANKKNWLQLDNGYTFKPPSNKKGEDILQKLQKRQEVLQKKLAIKYAQNKKLRYDKENNKWYITKNYLKLVEKLNKVYDKQVNIRKDRHHYISTQIVRRYDKIIIEDLKLQNMTRSSKGNEEEHGKNVKQKSGLNRTILNAGLGMSKQFMEYKAKYSGKKLIEIDPKYTSITCIECGNQNKKNRKSRDVFKCTKCGYTLDADLNSARNIRRKSNMR